jgi:hypothetical protein
LLMPIEGALITQFIGFVALYYVDAGATKMGWTPYWYRTYRFVLTGIVGASIMLTLIGRSELPDHIPGSVDRAKVFKEGSEDKLSKEEGARMQKKKKDAAAADTRDGKKNEDKKEAKEENKQDDKQDDKQADKEGEKDEAKDEGKENGDEEKKDADNEEEKKDDKKGDEKEDKSK